ncbi:MAG: hypothetical protein JW927_12420 [Deltaproteobacteria bacterium]|nr:hypothetical protein [Deltaproteobacteria bacterium]
MRILKPGFIILFSVIFCCFSAATVTAASMPWLFLLLGENTAPTANAGADQTIKTNTAATLNGSSSSDADNDPITYSWTMESPEGSSASLTNPTSSEPYFTPDIDGVYTLTLIVNDGKVSSAPDTVVITAVSNFPPVANAGPDQTVSTGTAVSLNGSGSSDPDGDTLKYYWSIEKPTNSTAVIFSNVNFPTAQFTPDVDGIYTITLIVNDGKASSAPDTVVITSQTGQ